MVTVRSRRQEDGKDRGIKPGRFSGRSITTSRVAEPSRDDTLQAFRGI